MRSSTTSVVLFCIATPAVRAQAPLDTAARLAPVGHEVVRIGRQYGDSIWPDFRPDTIPLSFVLPEHGDFLIGWRGALPPGYAAVVGQPGMAWREQRALGAASTGTELAGRRVAQIVVTRLDPASLASTAIHEAFHVFQAASQHEGQRFGQGENAFYVASYPVFDVDNERDMALEGRLLAAALDATTPAAKRRLAQEFVAVRRERHRRIGPEMAQFDQASEINEGLAQYALVRALRYIAMGGPAEWRSDARRQLAEQRRRLDELTTNTTQSFRLRYYATGPAIALLTDALAGSAWKQRFVAENWTLQDALADASGVDDVARAARARAVTANDTALLRAQAVAAVAHLESLRRQQADSVLAVPGIRLVLTADSLPRRDFDACRFDPQNLLQITPTMQLQTRFWAPCAGKALTSELDVPSVHDDRAGTVTAVIGPERDVRLATAGAPLPLHDGQTTVVTSLTLDAPRATVRAARAEISRRGDVITIRPLP